MDFDRCIQKCVYLCCNFWSFPCLWQKYGCVFDCISEEVWKPRGSEMMEPIKKETKLYIYIGCHPEGNQPNSGATLVERFWLSLGARMDECIYRETLNIRSHLFCIYLFFCIFVFFIFWGWLSYSFFLYISALIIFGVFFGIRFWGPRGYLEYAFRLF